MQTVDTPDDSTAHLVTFFLRDAYGNITNVISDDEFGNHREACRTYEPTGTFPWATQNALGHTSFILYHPGLGVPLSVRDANGLVTKQRIDTFGQTVEQHSPNGSITTIATTRVKNGVWTTRVLQSTPGHGELETVLDSSGRTIQQRMLGPEVPTVGMGRVETNAWLVQDVRYDLLGRRVWQSIPRIEGDSVAESVGSSFEYDNAARLTKSTTPWGITTNTYVHDNVTTTEPGPGTLTFIAKKVESDGLGRPLTTTDPLQNVTRYRYGPFGALRRVELPDGTSRETKEDAYGRTTFDNDPDRGQSMYEFNGFDEVVKMHDAAGRHYAFVRDALGRTTQRSEALNISTYEYDSAPNGVGLLAWTKSADGHVEEFAYDDLSRPERTTVRLADGRTFEQRRAYDVFDRVDEIVYPGGFRIKRHYDATGTLQKLTQGASEDAVWTLDNVDVAGQTMRETFGNGAVTERAYNKQAFQLESIVSTSSGNVLQDLRYGYDPQFNVEQRFDARQGKSEWFRHDGLNRVECARITACTEYATCIDDGGACDTDVAYGATGTITFKSDVGQYVPDPLHPHAPQSAGVRQFGYDGVGNQIERPDISITYTEDDLPRQYIPRGGGQATTFEYAAEGKRVRRTHGDKETIYVGDLYAQETSGNIVIERFYVFNDERAITVVERLSSGDTWRFLHTDHLGSVDVVSNEAGFEVDRRSYDAWGAPRDPQWGGHGPISSNVATRRGFTWHEAEDDVGLINAKGRIYDPVITRFLQTDPVIADLLDAQTVNPYSYVFNRPLVFTDPSGFDAEPELPYWANYAPPNPAFVDNVYHFPPDMLFVQTLRAAREPPAAPPPVQAPAAADHAPSAPERVGPSAMTPAEQIAFGAGERALQLAPQLALGIVFNYIGPPSARGRSCTLPNCGPPMTGEQFVDALNQVNPVYIGAVDVVQGREAHEKGDYVGVGRAGMGVFTTVVVTAITLKAGMRRVPSPNGKKGGLAHQALVKEVMADVERRGLKVVEEYKVDTPNGDKSKRFVDVAGIDPATQ